MLTLTLHANGVAPTPDPYLVTRFDPGHGDHAPPGSGHHLSSDPAEGDSDRD